MKNKIVIGIGLVILVLAVLGTYLLGSNSQIKIGYVRSNDLIYGFKGTKSVQDKFNMQSQLYQVRLDSMIRDYHAALSQYQINLGKFSEKESQERKELIIRQEQNIQHYKSEIQDKEKEAEAKLMEGVLNQINTAVQKYGQDNDFAIIMGTTQQGNILYADSTIDVTEPILNILNNEFE